MTYRLVRVTQVPQVGEIRTTVYRSPNPLAVSRAFDSAKEMRAKGRNVSFPTTHVVEKR